MNLQWLTDGCAVSGKGVPSKTRGAVLAVMPSGVVAAVQAVSGVWVADTGRNAWLGVPIAVAWHTDTVGVVVSISALHAVGAFVPRVTLVAHRLANCVCQITGNIKQAFFRPLLLCSQCSLANDSVALSSKVSLTSVAKQLCIVIKQNNNSSFHNNKAVYTS